MAEIRRCQWVEGKPDYYLDYHDHTWGKPEHDDRKLFKWLLLESFHVGLSWQLVLSKMEAFEQAFDGFDYQLIAQYDDIKLAQLMMNAQLIRHRGKIKASVANAQAFLKVQAEFGSFDAYIWHFTKGEVVTTPPTHEMQRNDLSDIVTADLKRRGFKFIGSVTIFSYLQAIGLLNSHEEACFLSKR